MVSWRKPAEVVAEVEGLMKRLQARDAELITVLGRHQVLTLVQIRRLFFGSASSARDRVTTLYELGVLRRFRPGWTRAAHRYALSHLGWRVYTALDGDDEAKPPTKKAAEDRFTRLAHSAKRKHLEEVNDFFTRLSAGLLDRHGQRVVLADWEPETDLGRVRPDGAGTIHDGNRVIAFWFEHDTGTEPLATLVRKIDRYVDGQTFMTPRPLLFQLPNPTRQHNLHNAIAPMRLGFTVATTITDSKANPAGPVWWPIGGPAGRLRCIHQLPKPPETHRLR